MLRSQASRAVTSVMMICPPYAAEDTRAPTCTDNPHSRRQARPRRSACPPGCVPGHRRPALREDRPLPVDSRRHRRRRLVKRHEHRVTLGLDDDAAVDRENSGQNVTVTLEHGPIIIPGRSSSRVDPSMSVNRSVTVPRGKGGTGVTARLPSPVLAAVRVKSTARRRARLDAVA